MNETSREAAIAWSIQGASRPGQLGSFALSDIVEAWSPEMRGPATRWIAYWVSNSTLPEWAKELWEPSEREAPPGFPLLLREKHSSQESGGIGFVSAGVTSSPTHPAQPTGPIMADMARVLGRWFRDHVRREAIDRVPRFDLPEEGAEGTSSALPAFLALVHDYFEVPIPADWSATGSWTSASGRFEPVDGLEAKVRKSVEFGYRKIAIVESQDVDPELERWLRDHTGEFLRLPADPVEALTTWFTQPDLADSLLGSSTGIRNALRWIQETLLQAASSGSGRAKHLPGIVQRVAEQRTVAGELRAHAYSLIARSANHRGAGAEQREAWKLGHRIISDGVDVYDPGLALYFETEWFAATAMSYVDAGLWGGDESDEFWRELDDAIERLEVRSASRSFRNVGELAGLLFLRNARHFRRLFTARLTESESLFHEAAEDLLALEDEWPAVWEWARSNRRADTKIGRQRNYLYSARATGERHGFTLPQRLQSLTERPPLEPSELSSASPYDVLATVQWLFCPLAARAEAADYEAALESWLAEEKIKAARGYDHPNQVVVEILTVEHPNARVRERSLAILRKALEWPLDPESGIHTLLRTRSLATVALVDSEAESRIRFEINQCLSVLPAGLQSIGQRMTNCTMRKTVLRCPH